VSLEVTVRRVCAKCNNGWMSELEERAKPILKPLIRAGSRTLSANDADTVAFWCMKTALLFQLTHPDRREAPDDHYRWVYEKGTPPPNAFIWAAGYKGTRWSSWYMHQILGLRDPGASETTGRGYCMTVVTGAFVFQVTGVDAIEPMEVEKASEQEPYILQLWPSKRRMAISLPPPLLLNDMSLPQFADPFGAENMQDLLT
jgi:hypothetical protein